MTARQQRYQRDAELAARAIVNERLAQLATAKKPKVDYNSAAIRATRNMIQSVIDRNNYRELHPNDYFSPHRLKAWMI